MIPPASTLPQNTGSGYVAAAYIVFVAIVLIYVTIMAVRLSRMERDLRELRARADQPQPTAQTRPAGGLPGADHAQQRGRPRPKDGESGPTEGPPGQSRERETV